MKRHLSFILLLVIFCYTKLNAHEYHFSFAEVEYNKKCSCLQISLSVAAHDIELVLQKQGLLKGSLENNIDEYGFSSDLKKEFLDHFIINIDNAIIALSIDGYEFSDDGLLYLYLSSKKIDITSSSVLHFKYDLLMESFTEQQNKLIFTFKTFKQTLSFINNSRESSMILTIPKRKIND